MADSLDEKHIETGTNLAAAPAAQGAADRAARTSADKAAAEARKARIK